MRKLIQNMEPDHGKILTIFGVIFFFMGLFADYKAFTDVLPAGLGLLGVVWAAIAIAFTVLGVVFFVVGRRVAKRPL